MEPPLLSIKDLRVRYGGRSKGTMAHDALAGIDVDIGRGQLVAVLGPSGSGKTTLLRAISGLEPISAGRILLDGADLEGVPVHERGVGLMFQDYALFPHLDAAGNVGFGPRIQGRDRAAVRSRADELLAAVGLAGLGDRPVSQLSGGEQQRVALARALAAEPRLLMLDEPLGSLDRVLRERIPLELRALFRALGSTVIYVTHDQDEAFTIADRVLVLDAGRLVADGSPGSLWAHPTSVWLARFLGSRNVGRATIADGQVRTPWGTLALELADPDLRPATGRDQLDVLLRPDGLRLVDQGPISGHVVSRRFLGGQVLVVVSVDGAADRPSVELEVAARPGRLPQVGDTVAIEPEHGALVIIPDATL